MATGNSGEADPGIQQRRRRDAERYAEAKELAKWLGPLPRNKRDAAERRDGVVKRAAVTGQAVTALAFMLRDDAGLDRRLQDPPVGPFVAVPVNHDLNPAVMLDVASMVAAKTGRNARVSLEPGPVLITVSPGEELSELVERYRTLSGAVLVGYVERQAGGQPV